MGASDCHYWTYVASVAASRFCFTPDPTPVTLPGVMAGALQPLRPRTPQHLFRGVVAMSDAHPTAPCQPVKPAKPSPDFPLFPHAAGVWAKKIRGRLHYFGSWNDPDGALAKYLEQKDALHSGRKPRPDTDGLTVRELANRFLNAKQSLVDAGELSPRTWAEYKATTDLLVETYGKRRLVADLDPDDFAKLRN